MTLTPSGLRPMKSQSSYDLVQLAKQDILERGLSPDFIPEALKQLDTIQKPASSPPNAKDLRNFLWASIDNDDSLDLDQLTYAEKTTSTLTTLYIAIADVDALVQKNTPLDLQAQINTTSIYTPAKSFPMLPEKLSTNLTSLNEKEDRLAMVVKIEVSSQEGEISGHSIFPAIVHNQAKLTYNAVGAWLEGKEKIPDKISQVAGLERVIRLQNEIAQTLKKRRHSQGTLSLETAEAIPLIKDDKVIGMKLAVHNLAHELIEHFMIASNIVIARFLAASKVPSLRRVVRVPKRWDRIVDLADAAGEWLPDQPDSTALDIFLTKMRNKDSVAFQDLSLSVIKLLGNGEYVVEVPGEKPLGHFGLALKEYTHSTAPNRRYPDIITQRQLKAILNNAKASYEIDELKILAEHCTKQEDAAAKVERQMNKSAAAMLLSSRIGESFKGIVTGATEIGTWVRIFAPPTEGKIIKEGEKFDVGDRVMATLLGVDIPKGYIDFSAVRDHGF